MVRLIAAVAGALILAAGPGAADGIIIPDPPFEPLSIGYHRVEVEIDGQAARTQIDQTFRNRQRRDVEGTYMFPLPEGAGVSDFSMHVDGLELEAELLDAEEARRIYEEIVRRRIDPALLEYVGRGAYRARIFPIPAGGERRVELAYDEVLERDGGLVRYTYPLNTEKFSAEALDDVSVQVSIRAGGSIGAVYSPSHPIEVERLADGEVRVVYADEGVTPRQDFVLYYAVADDPIGMELLNYYDEDGQGYYMLLAAPEVKPLPEPPIAKRMVFAFDRSGSMRDEKIEQARRALRYAVENLGPEDEFNIIDYGTTVSAFADSAAAAQGENLDQALRYIEGIEAGGGTHIHGALLRALEDFRGDGFAETLVFMTDGQPTIGRTGTEEILEAVLQARQEGVRLFVFGVGHEINTLLLDRLALQNGGTAAYVAPEEDIEARVSGFFAKISRPALTDLRVSFVGGRATDPYPQALPDLFHGGQVTRLGLLERADEIEVELRGRVQGAQQRFSRRFSLGGDGPQSLPRLWATRKVGFLLEQVRLNGEDEELVEEIVELSRRHGIITPYTSFLIVEDEPPAPLVELDGGGLRAASGADAVEASESLRSYAEAATPAESRDGAALHVGPKTFFRRGDYWRDSRFSPAAPVEEYSFGSQAYFDLVSRHPKWRRYLALGTQVEFVYAGGQIRVVESGTAVRNSEASTPVLHRLESVYPNPFNGAAVLRFSTAGGSVDLAVYDALGQRLRTLVRGERAAGTYSVRWDGLDAEGRSAASGTYLVRLQVGRTVQSRSLVLLQ